MDDYAKEIIDLQREVETLVEAEGDPKEIAELELQVRVLRAIYEQATNLFERGNQDADLPRRLTMRGYGPWSLDNVYAFVYEAAVELPDPEPRAFVKDITQTDFVQLLVAT